MIRTKQITVVCASVALLCMQKVWTPLKKCFRASRMTCCSESLSPEKPMWRLSPVPLPRNAGKKRNSSGCSRKRSPKQIRSLPGAAQSAGKRFM